MADSNITKQALAASLRELMRTTPFDKINVAQICEQCGMSRKSFYYHFKDKYDLVNWIFDTELIPIAVSSGFDNSYREQMAFIEKACSYFYENRDFYQSALQITGQNSFSEHFSECIEPILKNRLTFLLGSDQVDDFTLDFFTDAILCAVKRWLLAKDCMGPEQFVSKIERMFRNGAFAIYQEVREEKEAL